jgi:hypothetical protein
MLRSAFMLALTSFAAVPAAAGKPPSSPPNQQVAYRLLNSNQSSLVFANEDGSATSTVYSGPAPFRFDLGPRVNGVRQVAIVQNLSSGRTARVLLVTTSLNSSGLLVGSVPQLLAEDARASSSISFSPDGRKLAYACCSDGQQESLVVRDLDTGQVTTWARAPYYWDIQWFRGGSSLAYSTLGPTEVYEVAGPMAAPTLLIRPRSDGSGEVVLDAVNGQPDKLLLSYNDTSGAARIGIWNAVTSDFDNSDLANTTMSFHGNLNCTNSKLAFLGTGSSSGGQVWYIRDLTTNLNSRFRRDSNILLQFWPTCWPPQSVTTTLSSLPGPAFLSQNISPVLWCVTAGHDSGACG